MNHICPNRKSPLQSFEAMSVADAAYVAGHPAIASSAWPVNRKGPALGPAMPRRTIGSFIRRHEHHFSRMVEDGLRGGQLRAAPEEKSAARLCATAIRQPLFRALAGDEAHETREAAR